MPSSRTTLFCGGISTRTRAKDLAYEFERYGRLVRCDIPAPRPSSRTAYAFVEFEDPRDAEDAYYGLQGVRFEGYVLSLQWAKREPSHSWRYDGGRGRSRSPRRRSPSPRRGKDDREDRREDRDRDYDRRDDRDRDRDSDRREDRDDRRDDRRDDDREDRRRGEKDDKDDEDDHRESSRGPAAPPSEGGTAVENGHAPSRIDDDGPVVAVSEHGSPERVVADDQ